MQPTSGRSARFRSDASILFSSPLPRQRAMGAGRNSPTGGTGEDRQEHGADVRTSHAGDEQRVRHIGPSGCSLTDDRALSGHRTERALDCLYPGWATTSTARQVRGRGRACSAPWSALKWADQHRPTMGEALKAHALRSGQSVRNLTSPVWHLAMHQEPEPAPTRCVVVCGSVARVTA